MTECLDTRNQKLPELVFMVSGVLRHSVPETPYTPIGYGVLVCPAGRNDTPVTLRTDFIMRYSTTGGVFLSGALRPLPGQTGTPEVPFRITSTPFQSRDQTKPAKPVLSTIREILKTGIHEV